MYNALQLSNTGYIDLSKNNINITPLPFNRSQFRNAGSLAGWNFRGNGANNNVENNSTGNPFIKTQNGGYKILASVKGYSISAYVNNGLVAINQIELTLIDCVNAGKYLSFVISPEPDSKINITYFNFRPVSQNRSRTFTFFDSVTGFGIGSQIFNGNYSGNLGQPVISIPLNLFNITVPVEIRVFIYGFNNQYEAVGCGNAQFPAQTLPDVYFTGYFSN